MVINTITYNFLVIFPQHTEREDFDDSILVKQDKDMILTPGLQIYNINVFSRRCYFLFIISILFTTAVCIIFCCIIITV
jgi:hypothetical protein